MCDSGTNDELPDLIERLAPVAYPTLRLEYLPSCCIAAASILIRVFAEYGYRAEPIPVSVEVYNAAMLKLFAKGIQLPKDRDKRAMMFDLTGAWGVGICPASAALSALNEVPGGGYGGHLLLRVKNYLIDATIQQAERPEKKILLPALLANPHAQTLERLGRLNLEVNDCVVRYTRLDDQSYRTAPDWGRRTTPYPETVRRILAGLEKQ